MNVNLVKIGQLVAGMSLVQRIAEKVLERQRTQELLIAQLRKRELVTRAGYIAATVPIGVALFQVTRRYLKRRQTGAVTSNSDAGLMPPSTPFSREKLQNAFKGVRRTSGKIETV